MPFDIVIGPDSSGPGFDIVITTTEAESSLLDMPIPSVPHGHMMIALVLRVGEVICADSTWTKVVDGAGGGPGDTIRLDVYARIADGTQGDIVSFLSVSEQELQGSLLTLENADVDTVIEAAENLAFTEDAAPNAPAADSSLTENTVLCVWSASGDIAFAPSSRFTLLDTYSSAEVSSRSLLVASRRAFAIDNIDPGDAVASPAATGRAFTLVLHYNGVSGDKYARMMVAMLPPGNAWQQ